MTFDAAVPGIEPATFSRLLASSAEENKISLASAIVVIMGIERVEAKQGEFVSTAVEWLVKHINQFIKEDGDCLLGLSGGMYSRFSSYFLADGLDNGHVIRLSQSGPLYTSL